MNCFRRAKCPNCGKFVSNIIAIYRTKKYRVTEHPETIISGDKEINKVEGKCKKCGVVDITRSSDWTYDDFFPEE